MYFSQVALLIGKEQEYVWEAFAKFTHQLDQLQQKGESFANESFIDPVEISGQYWNKVGSNLVALVKKLDNSDQVCMVSLHNSLEMYVNTICKSS